MKLRLREHEPGKFILETKKNELSGWMPQTYCGSIEQADNCVAVYLEGLKARRELADRRAQGKDIIKEWEV